MTDNNLLIVREKKEPGTSGPPSIVVTDAGLKTIEDMAAEGNSDASICKVLGVGHNQLKHLKEDERVATAYYTGKGRLADELHDILMGMARDGNVAAAIYLSKARLGWRDQGPATNTGNATQVNIHIPPAMSDMDFNKLINVVDVEDKLNE